jgi:hypothetical protein
MESTPASSGTGGLELTSFNAQTDLILQRSFDVDGNRKTHVNISAVVNRDQTR